MLGHNAYFATNRWLKLDYLLGLRAFGLIVYGALPASLGALGAFKTPDQSVLDSKIGVSAIIPISVVALIPVVLTFALVRQRLANWYLLPVYLNVRAVVITVGIILISSVVVFATGFLVGTYQLIPVSTWKNLSVLEKLRPALECLLLSFAYLVGSSTLFLTVVKEDGSLPLLPAKQEVDDLRSLRASLKEALTNPLHTQQPTARNAQLTAQVAALTKSSSEANETIKKLMTGFTGLGRDEFYQKLSTELDNLKKATEDVGTTAMNWRYYWGVNPGNLGDAEEARRNSIENLRELAFNG